MWALESNALVKYNSTVISFLRMTCLLTLPPWALTLLPLCWFNFHPDPGPISDLEINISFWTNLLLDDLFWALCKTICQQRLEICQVFSKLVISYRMTRSCLKQACWWCCMHVRCSPGTPAIAEISSGSCCWKRTHSLAAAVGVLGCSALVRFGPRRTFRTFPGLQDALP